MVHLRDALSNLHKVAHKGVYEVALKGVLEAGLKLRLWLYLLMQLLIRKCVQMVHLMEDLMLH